jgi:hypothetical protein
MNPVVVGIAIGVPVYAVLGVQINALEWLLCLLAWYVIGGWTARKFGPRISGFWSRVWTR